MMSTLFKQSFFKNSNVKNIREKSYVMLIMSVAIPSLENQGCENADPHILLYIRMFFHMSFQIGCIRK